MANIKAEISRIIPTPIPTTVGRLVPESGMGGAEAVAAGLEVPVGAFVPAAVALAVVVAVAVASQTQSVSVWHWGFLQKP